ncbi:MAG: anthranilate phosphoribosyltransferase [Eubacteriaceae bacterium]|nr:anthranilate phosphoribosyltransferase [Eubacteriaceae bacterium]
MEMKEFGGLIAKLSRRENLSKEESDRAFTSLLNNEQNDMQQGAFLSALTTKGETIEEMAACWRAIYHVDTIKPETLLDMSFTDNSGTGMDTFKTFNVSTAASIIAAAAGIKMAKHGSRALTSMCGTIDLLETLGIDVEGGAEPVVQSIEKTGIGIFNGMSPKVHPQALGRILSQISFGTILNISASLANPALPKYAVRGVYSKEMLVPVAKLMREIGYIRAMIIFGEAEGFSTGMDEASTIGKTYVAKLSDDGAITEYCFTPEDLGITRGNPDDLRPLKDREAEAVRFIEILNGSDKGTRSDIVCLNSGLILELMGVANSLKEGYEMSKNIIDDGRAYQKLFDWVTHQNSDDSGVKKLEILAAKAN